MQLDPSKLLGFRLSCTTDRTAVETKAGAKTGGKRLISDQTPEAIRVGAKIGSKFGNKPVNEMMMVALGSGAGAKIGVKPVDTGNKLAV